MSGTPLAQVNFSGGELTPLAGARTDLTKYGTSLRTCINWVIRPHGCLMNRPGLKYRAATRDSGAKASRLVPFEFNDEQSYILEFSDGFIRVYQNGVYQSIELASPYLLADLATLQYTQSADVLTITVNRVPQYEVRRTSTGPLAFNIVAAEYDEGPFLLQNFDEEIQVSVSAITGSVTITANLPIFEASHVGGLFRIEQEDLSTLKPWEPTKVLKTGATTPVGEIRTNDGKTYKCVAAAVAAANTATGTNPPVHDSGIEMDGDGGPIASFADVVGVSWQYLDSGFGIARITGFTSSTSVTATVLRQFPSTVVGSSATVGHWSFTGTGAATVFGPLTGNTSAVSADYIVVLSTTGILPPSAYTVTQPNGNITFTTAPGSGVSINVYQTATGAKRSSLWSFGAWSPNQGYPATCTYFQDRIFFAGTTAQPQGVWGSKPGLYYDFGKSVPSEDSDSLAFFLNARKINAITDLIPSDRLLAATSAGIQAVTDGIDEVLTPSTVGFKAQNSFGAAKGVRSEAVGDSYAYAQKDQRRVRDLLYTVDYDKFTGNELSILAEHLFPKGTTITRLSYAQYPFSLLHAVRSDGVMPTLSYLREQEVVGWSPWETQGFIEDARSITEGVLTTTYLIVRRVVNGVSVRYIESFAEREFADIDDAFFVDAGNTYDGRRTSSAILTGGVTWLQGESLLLTVVSGDFNPLDAAAQYGNEAWLYSGDDAVRVSFTNYIGSSNTMQCTPISDVPASLQGIATTEWTVARRNIPAAHLVGNSVVICADGLDVDPQVVGAYAGIGVLLAHPGGVVHIGLSYVSDLEILNPNIPGAPAIVQKYKTIPRASVLQNQGRGLSIGPDADHLDPLPPREYEDYTSPPDLEDNVRSITIPTKSSPFSRIYIRQSAPLPVTITGLIPEVEVGQ